MTDKIDENKIEETIKAIALKHGIALGKDDPILILQTINDRLMEDSKKAQQEALSDFKSVLEDMLDSWGKEAKSKAERTLNATIKASKELINESVNNNANVTASIINETIKKILIEKLKPEINQSKTIAMINLAAASMALIASMTILYIQLKK